MLKIHLGNAVFMAQKVAVHMKQNGQLWAHFRHVCLVMKSTYQPCHVHLFARINAPAAVWITVKFEIGVF
jgi:hypothetical protein